ncbi:hypothetical protein KJ815_06310, partial [bacterium]|nr:hypothetical protein [bacterium]
THAAGFGQRQPRPRRRHNKYVMRITGDNDEGKAQLDNFINPEKTFPVIATTSQLMSTGRAGEAPGILRLPGNTPSFATSRRCSIC